MVYGLSPRFDYRNNRQLPAGELICANRARYTSCLAKPCGRGGRSKTDRPIERAAGSTHCLDY
jgi:hypothetical protein